MRRELSRLSCIYCSSQVVGFQFQAACNQYKETYTAVLRLRWGCTIALAGGADQEATAAGDAATGFDFGDAAHMAAEFAPMLGGSRPLQFLKTHFS